MRKRILVAGIWAIIASLLLITGCESDDASPQQATVESLLAKGEMKGILRSNYTLDPSVSYQLTGKFVVDNSATLTIPAGTRILAVASQGQETETVTNAYVKHTIQGFSTVVEADGVNNNPAIINLTAVNTHASAPAGIALQFKKQSGATMTNLYLEGYSTLVDMPNSGPLANVIIEGAPATLAGPYLTGKLNISAWTWFQ